MSASSTSPCGSGANRPSTISNAVSPLLKDLIDAAKTNFASHGEATNNATGPETPRRLTNNDRVLLRNTVTSLANIFDNAMASTELPTFVFGIVTGLHVRLNRSTGQYVLDFIITDPSMQIASRHDAAVIPNCTRYVQLYLTKADYREFGFSEDAGRDDSCNGSVIVLCRPVLDVNWFLKCVQLFMASDMACMMLAEWPHAEKLEAFSRMVCSVNNPNALRKLYDQNFRGSSVFFGHPQLAMNANVFGEVHALYCSALLRWWHHILPEKMSDCGNKKTLRGSGSDKLLLDFALKMKPELAALVDEELCVKEYLAARKKTSSASTETLTAAERAGIQASICDAKKAIVEHATYRMRVVVRCVSVIKMDVFLRFGHENEVGQKAQGATSAGLSQPFSAQQQSQSTSHLTITSQDSDATNRSYIDAIWRSNSDLPDYNSAESGAYVWCIYVQRLPDYDSPNIDNKPGARNRKKVYANEAGACRRLQSFVEIKKSSVPVPNDVMLKLNQGGELIPVYILPDECQYQMFFGALLDGPHPVNRDKMGQIHVTRFYRILSLFHYLVQHKLALTIDFELQFYATVRYKLMQGYWGKFYQSLKEEKRLSLRPGPSSGVLPLLQRAAVPTSDGIAEKESRGQQRLKESTPPLPPQNKYQPPTASFIERPLPQGGLPVHHLHLLKCSEWLPRLDYVVDLDDFERYREEVWCKNTPNDEKRMSVESGGKNNNNVSDGLKDLHADDQPEEAMSVSDIVGINGGHNNAGAGVPDRDAADAVEDDSDDNEEHEENVRDNFDNDDDDDASKVASSSVSVAVPPTGPGEVATADYSSQPE